MATINEKMTALADAVRDKSGRTDTLTIDEMTTAVQGIETGTDTSDATATADEIFAGETAYTANGKVTGTFTIEEELTEQNDLISQISALVATKANPQSSTPEDLDEELTEQESLISELSSILDSKASGGSGSGSVEYEIVNLTENTTSISFTLKRLTATYGMCTSSVACGQRNLAHQGLSAISAYNAGGTSSFARQLTFSSGILSSGIEFAAPYTAVFINDPSQEAIYQENN